MVGIVKDLVSVLLARLVVLCERGVCALSGGQEFAKVEINSIDPGSEIRTASSTYEVIALEVGHIHSRSGDLAPSAHDSCNEWILLFEPVI